MNHSKNSLSHNSNDNIKSKEVAIHALESFREPIQLDKKSALNTFEIMGGKRINNINGKIRLNQAAVTPTLNIT